MQVGTTKEASNETSKPVIAAILLTVWATQNALAAELQPDTLMAWNAYLKDGDLHMQERAASGLPFLWMDESPDRAAGVRREELLIARDTLRCVLGEPHPA